MFIKNKCTQYPVVQHDADVYHLREVLVSEISDCRDLDADHSYKYPQNTDENGGRAEHFNQILNLRVAIAPFKERML